MGAFHMLPRGNSMRITSFSVSHATSSARRCSLNLSSHEDKKKSPGSQGSAALVPCGDGAEPLKGTVHMLFCSPALQAATPQVVPYLPLPLASHVAPARMGRSDAAPCRGYICTMCPHGVVCPSTCSGYVEWAHLHTHGGRLGTPRTGGIWVPVLPWVERRGHGYPTGWPHRCPGAPIGHRYLATLRTKAGVAGTYHGTVVRAAGTPWRCGCRL